MAGLFPASFACLARHGAGIAGLARVAALPRTVGRLSSCSRLARTIRGATSRSATPRAQQARLHRRLAAPPSRPQRCWSPRGGGDVGSAAFGGFDTRVEALQGSWSDEIGLAIDISGDEAHFADGSGKWKIEQEEGALVPRGARLVGAAAAPVWSFPTGAERRWARVHPEGFQPEGSGSGSWSRFFLRFKEDRQEQRHALQAAFKVHDFDRIAQLRAAWESGAEAPGASAVEKAALAAGAFIVPGVCFRHRRFNYRGVVLGFEPWCCAPAQWRAQMRVAQLTKGEAQPFYHCLVDERDNEGEQAFAFVAEEHIAPCSISFPIRAGMVDTLLVRCEALGGYLPSQALLDALRRQMAVDSFVG